MLVVGLSGENMTRLMANEPIIIDAAKHGVGEFSVLVVGGRTEEVIAEQLTAIFQVPAPVQFRPNPT